MPGRHSLTMDRPESRAPDVVDAYWQARDRARRALGRHRPKEPVDYLRESTDTLGAR